MDQGKFVGARWKLCTHLKLNKINNLLLYCNILCNTCVLQMHVVFDIMKGKRYFFLYALNYVALILPSVTAREQKLLFYSELITIQSRCWGLDNAPLPSVICPVVEGRQRLAQGGISGARQRRKFRESKRDLYPDLSCWCRNHPLRTMVKKIVLHEGPFEQFKKP